MSSMYDSRVVYPPEFDEVDLTQCETCKHKDYDFQCGQIGYCITDCGEGYVLCRILEEKGYIQANMDWAVHDGELVEGIELYKRQCQKFMENLKKLGYNSTIRHHPLQKNYLSTVIIDGYKPIELCHIFLKLDVIK